MLIFIYFLFFKQNVLRLCQEGKLPPVKWAVIVQENHHLESESGSSNSTPTSKHLHAIITFSSELDIHDPNFLDQLANGQHGNYAGVRSLKKSLAYLRKEDQDPLEFGERKGEGSPKSSVSTEIATLILGGKTTRDLINHYEWFDLWGEGRLGLIYRCGYGHQSYCRLDFEELPCAPELQTETAFLLGSSRPQQDELDAIGWRDFQSILGGDTGRFLQRLQRRHTRCDGFRRVRYPRPTHTQQDLGGWCSETEDEGWTSGEEEEYPRDYSFECTP